MSIGLIVLILGVVPPLAVAIIASLWHDIHWSRQCATANARYAADRARWQAEATRQAERAAAIAAIRERNALVARRGGSVMVFEGIPDMLEVQP